MLQTLSDTLSCDTVLLHQYRIDEAYNYVKELQNSRDRSMGLADE